VTICVSRMLASRMNRKQNDLTIARQPRKTQGYSRMQTFTAGRSIHSGRTVQREELSSTPNYGQGGTISRGPSTRPSTQNVTCDDTRKNRQEAAKRGPYNLGQAAKLLRVAYKTARRLCLAQGCARYSCGPGDEVIFPGDKVKRRTVRTRMTWKITGADIAQIRLRMRTSSKLAA
jgi:hypothetical protein